MYDLHLHSTYSDGTCDVAELLERAAQAGVVGLSLTDHDGLWGLAEAATIAAQRGLRWLEGIEVSAVEEPARVHVLGYSRGFDRAIIEAGLAETRQAHYDRLVALVAACHQAGYGNVSLEAIEATRATQLRPGFVTYDVEQELIRAHQLTPNEAHRLTTPGGTCYVEYDHRRALTPLAAIDLIHQAGGVAVLAHPGIIAHEGSEQQMLSLISQLAEKLDGLEVNHPFHSRKLTGQLAALAGERELVVTGGSDWHGEGRYDDTALGQTGISKRQWEQLLERIG